MPKKHNKSKRSKKNKRKDKLPRQLETISPGSQSEEDNPQPGPSPESIPQPGTSKAYSLQPSGTSEAESPEPRSSDEGSPYEETEPRVPLIPGVGLPGRQHQEREPQDGASGLCRRTQGRSRRKDKRTKSLEHTPESSPPKSDESSRSHSVGSSGNGASPKAEKQSLFNEDMSFDDVTEVMYRRYKGEGYVRSAAMLRVTFETKRSIEDVIQLINARIPEAQEAALEDKKQKEKESQEKMEERDKKKKKGDRDKQ